MSDDLARISMAHQGTTTVVRVAGEVDLSNADTLEHELLQAAMGSEVLLLDLVGVRYLDSAGVRLVHSLARSLPTAGTLLRIVAPVDSLVREVLDLTATGALVEIVDSAFPSPDA
ncbi:MAG: STAS domain-containing protein [Gaiella sp.]